MTSLPLGEWAMNINSYGGSFFIDSIDAHNNIVGRTRLFREPEIKIYGAWDEAKRKLSFIRLVAVNDPHEVQSFTGFLLDDAIGKILAGTGQVYKGNTINGLDVGWYAHMDVPPPPHE